MIRTKVTVPEYRGKRCEGTARLSCTSRHAKEKESWRKRQYSRGATSRRKEYWSRAWKTLALEEVKPLCEFPSLANESPQSRVPVLDFLEKER